MKGIILSLTTLILAVVFFRFQQKEIVPEATHTLPVIVDVQGEVKKPGTYFLEGPSATVADALSAAGGTRRGANTLPVQISRAPVRTGERLLIEDASPEGFRIRVEPMQAAARLTLGLKLDLNSATEEELCLVPQMKPEFAAAIVERRRNGRWSSLRELESIKGVGLRTVEKWNDYLSVENTRF